MRGAHKECELSSQNFVHLYCLTIQFTAKLSSQYDVN